jgi:DNA polymerase-3 subunit epsilon
MGLATYAVNRVNLLAAIRHRFSRSPVPRRTPLRDVRFVVLDTELTSLDKRTNRLLSVGAIAMRGPRILLGEQFYRVVNPGVDIPATSIVVHGLRPEDIALGDSPDAVLSDLHGFLGVSVLVGHFVGIDAHVLDKELRAIGGSLALHAIDTARAFHWLMLQKALADGHDHVSAPLDLASVAAHYSIAVHDAHHALVDAFVTAQVWQRILYDLEAAGVTTLGRALRIASR